MSEDECPSGTAVGARGNRESGKTGLFFKIVNRARQTKVRRAGPLNLRRKKSKGRCEGEDKRDGRQRFKLLAFLV